MRCRTAPTTPSPTAAPRREPDHAEQAQKRGRHVRQRRPVRPIGRTDAEIHVATDEQVIDSLPHSPGFQVPVLEGRDDAETVDFGLEGFPSDFTTWFDMKAGETVAEAGVYVPDAAITGTEDIDPFSAATSDEDEQKVQRASV